MRKSSKKQNRRMKRTVRRTIGALCLISAITIAAIPVPENMAYDPTTTDITAYNNVLATDSSQKIVDLAETKYLNAADKVSSLGNKSVKTYAVSKRNGIVSLDWQFEVKYTDAGQTKTNGFITKYNDAYVSDDSTLTVSNYLFADYAYIELDKAKEVTEKVTYYDGLSETTDIVVYYGNNSVTRSIKKLGIEYTLTGEPYEYIGDPSSEEDKKNPDKYQLTTAYTSSAQYKFFAEYYPDLLNDYLNAYKKYKIKDSSQSAPPTDLKKSLLDLPTYNSVELQEQYVCEQLLSGNTPSGKTFSLIPVTMMTYSGTTQSSKQIYIFKVLSGMDPISQNKFQEISTLLFTDSDCYLTTSYISMVGIAENAMENVSNVTELILDNNIRYICDKAFNNSSLLKSVTLPANAEIGRMAFANGKDLESISLGGLNVISTQAFYNTNIKNIEIPNSVTSIEDGAFANCSNLQTVTFTGATNNSVTIKAGAFADCPSLVSVDFGNAKIERIGNCAFALCAEALRVLDHMEDFTFPRFISSGDNLGDYTLAGRSKLTNVTLPTGLSGIQNIPEHLVIKCPNLLSFVFPDNCSQTSYESTMFSDVTNERFYVQGPAKDGTQFSKPRVCTWSAKKDVTGKNTPVTYRYTDPDTGKEIYEINQDGLVLGIDSEGILVNCQFDPDNIPTTPQSVTIPAYVGDVQLVGIADGCFTDDVKKWISEIIIEDGSGIETIANNSFEDFDMLEKVSLGDSVTTIGDQAFYGCNILKEVYIGENISSIGASAFANNKKLVDIYFDKPYQTNINSGNYLKTEDIGPNALTTGSDKLTVHGTIMPDYGPFAWSMAEDNFVDNKTGLRVCYNSPAPDNLTVILDNTNLLPTLVDYPHYEYLSDELRGKIESGATLDSVDDQYAYNCTRDIVIPAGVKSIDVKHFINATSEGSATGLTNGKSADTYLKNNSDFKYYEQYKEYGLFNGYYGMNTDTTHGTTIISGTSAYEYSPTKESADKDKYEKNNLGNDRIISVVMSDVEYLPDKAFENCERLGIVNLGGSMQDVGVLPFYDCTNLVSVACGNGTYVANNGILYENLSDGSKKIIECFASRGGAVGSSTVDTDADPDLANVREIANNAFDDCDQIRFVDFTDADNISTIPEGCFRNCDNLRTVELPTTVSSVEKDAFTNMGSDVEIVARNKTLFLSSGAIDDAGGNTPYFVTYKESQSRKYAKEQGANIDKTLDDSYTVRFYNHDGTVLLKTDFVQEGKAATPPDDEEIPDRTAEGLVFDKWSIDIKNITEDCFALALYKPIAGVTPGTTPGVTPGVTPGTTPGVTPGVTPGGGSGGSGSGGSSSTKYTLTVVYGSGSGQYAEGTKVIIEAIDAPAGKVFDKWVVTGAPATIYSSTSKSTTITTTNGDTAVTATYKDATSGSSSGSSSSSSTGATGTTNRNNTGTNGGNSGNSGTGGNSGTSVNITKPGISDIDKAYASVSGSTDNFVVKVTESQEAANAVATALANKYPDMTGIKYFAMDINLYDVTGNNQINDTSNLSVNITMPLPDALRQYAGNNRAASVINGNQLEDLPAKFVTVDGVPCISFTATHFSPYAIYVDTNNLTYGTADYSPKTGDPIHPKWFVVIALAATSLILFLKKDKVIVPRAV